MKITPVTPKSALRRHAALLVILALCCAVALQAAPPALWRVAPLFKHGEGDDRALLEMNFSIAPVLLTKAEACQLIRDELAKAKLTFTKEGPTYAKLSLAFTDKARATSATVQTAVTMDGSDPQHGIVFAFVSKQDADAIQPFPQVPTTLLVKAAALRAALQEQSAAGTAVVFYDPAVMVCAGKATLNGKDPLAGTTVAQNSPPSTLAPVEALTPLVDELYSKNDGIILTRQDPATKLLRTVLLRVGEKKMLVNDAAVPLPAAPTKRNATTYVPIIAVAKALGYQAKWTAETHALEIGTAKGVVVGHAEGSATPTEYLLAFQPLISSPVFLRETPDLTLPYPLAFLQQDTAEITRLAREHETLLLRLQVRDFLAWAKKEGVL